jgi:hypothetical protein
MRGKHLKLEGKDLSLPALQVKLQVLNVSSSVTWNSADFFPGMKAFHFVQLVRGRLDPNIGQGSFSVLNANQIEFFSQGYLARQRDEKMSELVSGRAPYCDLKELTESLHGLFSDIHDAEKFVQENYGDMSETDHSVQVLSHFAVSISYLDSIALQVVPKIESVVNLEVSY